MPGCESVEAAGPGRHKVTIRVQVGPIRTTFAVEVEAREERAPEFAAYVTSGEEGGRASRIRAESSLTLAAVDERHTEVHYASEINIVGRLGKFGTGMMQKKADAMGDEFVAALRAKLEGGAVPAAPAAPTAAPRALWPWVAGAAVVLVLLWWLFGRG
jgi:carbon monoxide dehydrogenase subunit G